MPNPKNAAPHLMRANQSTHADRASAALTHALLRTLSAHGLGGCTWQHLQATHPALTKALLAELQRRVWVSRGHRGEHSGEHQDAAEAHYIITATGQAHLNAAAAQQLRTQAAAAGHGQHAQPRRHPTIGGPIYAPQLYAIARPGGNDYLRHPSVIGNQLRYNNLAAGRWQNNHMGITQATEAQP